VVTAARAYLVSQAETAIYCGLGMTGGAADIVERYAPLDVRDELLGKLTSLDPATSWEGGMFLTERQGGSDVGANTTVAVQDGDEWLLSGDKHFCSNVDADVFIVLARPDGAPAGARGLATFIVPSRLPDGSPNGFVIKRLKPKLGTVGVPTGEVTLTGARAWLAGDAAPGSDGAGAAAGAAAGTPSAASGGAARDGRGINRMMEMVNGSRFGVALMGLGIHRRSFLEAAIYAAQREQWGQRIDHYPLVRETLVDLLVDLEAGLGASFECAATSRTALDAEEGRLLRRILIPLTKMRATRVAVGAASTALEVFGGNGYMNDWPMARQLRDAQCHTIWEGTENILCLDVSRAMKGEQAHLALLSRIERAIDAASTHKVLAAAADTVARSAADARTAIAHLDGVSDDLALLHSRRLAELLADTVNGALLLDDAAWSLDRDGDARKAAVARRFVTRKLANEPARGILNMDRSVLDHFEPLIRYGRIEADELAA
jgi:alkylation response protein AidB-like acyl-CoA dehydrogenase